MIIQRKWILPIIIAVLIIFIIVGLYFVLNSANILSIIIYIVLQFPVPNNILHINTGIS